MGQILLLHLIAHTVFLPLAPHVCQASLLPRLVALTLTSPFVMVLMAMSTQVCDGSQWQGSHCPHPLADRLSCILLE